MQAGHVGVAHLTARCVFASQSAQLETHSLAITCVQAVPVPGEFAYVAVAASPLSAFFLLGDTPRLARVDFPALQ